ncbi:hypothetical protein N9A28_02370 [Sulfurimonas sp.]|nr:hypothetical protein [Sulfurimonas sp.]
MQRKNNLLMPHKKTGFAMIMAIIVIVVISTIMALSLSLTTQTSKQTTDLYLYEQSVLYSKSAAERALLNIAQANPCTVASMNGSYSNGVYTANTSGVYDVNVTINYIYYDDPSTLLINESPCNATALDDYFTVTTPEQSGSVRMDITVTTNEGTEPIRYFRRTIQKL